MKGGGIVAGLESRSSGSVFVSPNYVVATPVLGGQASLGIGAFIGPNTTSALGTVTGPGGSSLTGSRSDSAFGIGDLYPVGSLRGNWGVNNMMTYLTGDIPVGLYNSQQLANLGIGHGAVDAGGGYTYFDQQTGHEFSAVIGATYNLINPSTEYKNGLDGHLDWGASQFLSASLQVGAVGYVYDQLTGDSGSGAKLGPFESRLNGTHIRGFRPPGIDDCMACGDGKNIGGEIYNGSSWVLAPTSDPRCDHWSKGGVLTAEFLVCEAALPPKQD